MARIFATPLLALALVALGPGTATAQEDARVFVEPASQTVHAGATFEAQVMVDDVLAADGLGGYTLIVEFDPAVVQARAIEDTGYVGSTGNAALCPSSGIDNETGRAALFCFTIPLFEQPGPQTSEPRAIATVTFGAAGPGTSPLTLDETVLTDTSGNTIIASTEAGEVWVIAAHRDGEEPVESSEGPGADAGAGESAGAGTGGDGATGTDGGSGLPGVGRGPGQEAGPGRWAVVALVLSGTALVATGAATRSRL